MVTHWGTCLFSHILSKFKLGNTSKMSRITPEINVIIKCKLAYDGNYANHWNIFSIHTHTSPSNIVSKLQEDIFHIFHFMAIRVSNGTVKMQLGTLIMLCTTSVTGNFNSCTLSTEHWWLVLTQSFWFIMWSQDLGTSNNLVCSIKQKF